MHGSLHSHVGRMTLADELLAFEKYTKLHNFDYAVVPCEDFADLNEYIDYLGSTGRCPGFAAEVNGGAQFMRLLLRKCTQRKCNHPLLRGKGARRREKPRSSCTRGPEI